ncbi:recombinase family protein [Aerococcaceae bacterium NML210727]|nr:recombinase family protein [Aerococcaceae bacterium NML210727]MCW6654713.1 recombinase family protein [Aerococcaceae bacterium NML201296]
MTQRHQLPTIKIGYARVSSHDERQQLGLAVQLDALQHCDFIFQERESGANPERSELQRAIQTAKTYAGQGRNVQFQVWRFDRLGRKMFHTLTIMSDLEAHNIRLYSISENLEMNSLTGKLLLIMMSWFAESERELLRQRTKEALQKKKAEGIQLGNPGIGIEAEQQLIARYQANHSVKEIIAQHNISRTTLYNVLKKYNIPPNRYKKGLANP